LEYYDNKQAVNLDTTPNCPLAHENLMMYFYALMKNAVAKVDQNFDALTGVFSLDTNIPISAGLGFSAAICLAVTDWVIWKGWVPGASKFDFARGLEDMFHGTSSGADIAACMADDIIVFKRPQSLNHIQATWAPHIYLTTTDTVSITSDAVAQVEQFRNSDYISGANTDKAMGEAVLQIIAGLQDNPSKGITTLAAGFNQAKKCFETWGLIPNEVNATMKNLQQAGAVAVKPTGAGNGGSLLSLWSNPPPESIAKQLSLTPVF